MKLIFCLLLFTTCAWADSDQKPLKQIDIDEEIINDLEFFQSIELIKEAENVINSNSISQDEKLSFTMIKGNNDED